MYTLLLIYPHKKNSFNECQVITLAIQSILSSLYFDWEIFYRIVSKYCWTLNIANVVEINPAETIHIHWNLRASYIRCQIMIAIQDFNFYLHNKIGTFVYKYYMSLQFSLSICSVCRFWMLLLFSETLRLISYCIVDKILADFWFWYDFSFDLFNFGFVFILYSIFGWGRIITGDNTNLTIFLEYNFEIWSA